MPFKDYAPYIMAVGCAGLLICHFAERYSGTNLRLSRLYGIRHITGLVYCVSAYFMFQPGMYWVLALLVAAVLEIYTLLVISHETDKK